MIDPMRGKDLAKREEGGEDSECDNYRMSDETPLTRGVLMHAPIAETYIMTSKCPSAIE